MPSYPQAFFKSYTDFDQALVNEQLNSKIELDYIIGKRRTLPYDINATSLGLRQAPYLANGYLTAALALTKINFPIQTLPFVFFKLKTWRKVGLLRLLLKYLINYARSVAFMATYTQGVKFMEMLTTHVMPIRGLMHLMGQKSFDWLISFITAWAIALEQPHKRVDITYFIMPRIVEFWWLFFKNRKMIRDLP
jgi:hypothetical protein